MGAFGGLIITNKGRALQAKAQTGIELTYTRIKVGDGKLGGQSILTLNDLISVKKSLDILKLEARPGGKAVVGSMLSNAGLKSGFYFREIGVFAQDPDEGEVLYCYANAGDNAEYIPPEGGPDVIEKYINAVTIIQNAQNVSAVIDSSLVYPTNKEMEVAIKEYFDANNNAKILAPKAFKATDSGDGYPFGVSMFYLDQDGTASGWPFNNGQVFTIVTGKNRVSQMVFETNIATQRIWTRRWSSTQKAWSDFLELETTGGSAEKVAKALKEAKAYTDEKTATIDTPVKSVNSKTGDVVLTAGDVGAVAKNGDAVIAGMLSMSKNDGPHLQLVGSTSAFGEWYVNNERKGWVGVGNRNEPSTIRLTSEVGPLAMQSNTDAVYIHGPEGVFLEGRRVVAELDLVKQSVVDGKGLVAEVINGKGGGPVSAYNTFPELAAGINRISTGGILDYSNGARYTAQNEKWDVWMATVPAFKRSMSFRTNEPFDNYETGSLMETRYGVSSIQFFVFDSSGKETEILQVSADSSRYEYFLIQSIEVDWINTVEQMVVFYRTSRYNSDYYKRIVPLPTDFNKNGQIGFKFRIIHTTTQKPAELRSDVSLRGRFIYI